MSFEEILKDYTPTENKEEGPEPLTGIYKCVISHLSVTETKSEPKKPCYKLELTITEILQGDGAAGRRFFRTYVKDDEKKMKQFLNDLFTAGINLPTKGGIDEFEGAFFAAIDTVVIVNARKWTPEKNQDGSPIAVEERVPVQLFKILNAAKTKVKAKSSDSVPF